MPPELDITDYSLHNLVTWDNDVIDAGDLDYDHLISIINALREKNQETAVKEDSEREPVPTTVSGMTRDKLRGSLLEGQIKK